MAHRDQVHQPVQHHVRLRQRAGRAPRVDQGAEHALRHRVAHAVVPLGRLAELLRQVLPRPLARPRGRRAQRLPKRRQQGPHEVGPARLRQQRLPALHRRRLGRKAPRGRRRLQPLYPRPLVAEGVRGDEHRLEVEVARQQHQRRRARVARERRGRRGALLAAERRGAVGQGRRREAHVEHHARHLAPVLVEPLHRQPPPGRELQPEHLQRARALVRCDVLSATVTHAQVGQLRAVDDAVDHLALRQRVRPERRPRRHVQHAEPGPLGVEYQPRLVGVQELQQVVPAQPPQVLLVQRGLRVVHQRHRAHQLDGAAVGRHLPEGHHDVVRYRQQAARGRQRAREARQVLVRPHGRADPREAAGVVQVHLPVPVPDLHRPVGGKDVVALHHPLADHLPQLELRVQRGRQEGVVAAQLADGRRAVAVRVADLGLLRVVPEPVLGLGSSRALHPELQQPLPVVAQHLVLELRQEPQRLLPLRARRRHQHVARLHRHHHLAVVADEERLELPVLPEVVVLATQNVHVLQRQRPHLPVQHVVVYLQLVGPRVQRHVPADHRRPALGGRRDRVQQPRRPMRDQRRGGTVPHRQRDVRPVYVRVHRAARRRGRVVRLRHQTHVLVHLHPHVQRHGHARYPAPDAQRERVHEQNLVRLAAQNVPPVLPLAEDVEYRRADPRHELLGARVEVPHHQHALLAPREQHRAVGVERHAVDAVRVPDERVHRDCDFAEVVELSRVRPVPRHGRRGVEGQQDFLEARRAQFEHAAWHVARHDQVVSGVRLRRRVDAVYGDAASGVAHCEPARVVEGEAADAREALEEDDSFRSDVEDHGRLAHCERHRLEFRVGREHVHPRRQRADALQLLHEALAQVGCALSLTGSLQGIGPLFGSFGLTFSNTGDATFSGLTDIPFMHNPVRQVDIRRFPICALSFVGTLYLALVRWGGALMVTMTTGGGAIGTNRDNLVRVKVNIGLQERRIVQREAFHAGFGVGVSRRIHANERAARLRRLDAQQSAVRHAKSAKQHAILVPALLRHRRKYLQYPVVRGREQEVDCVVVREGIT
ncbi:uncharacterized protein BcabD6B2_55110 [Babesia caballi]|uniref:Uncharacterized protein n=1 Tax=Babesia caballi TaxID=5871 RepID=A0AAV4M2H4_BABCB|nr:hypothetical protein BcabD6B2_55110 [Babesia caballi]